MDKHDQLRVSVVVPVYAGEKYLKELVASIERVRTTWVSNDSTLQLAEAIFVVDGAKDNSAKVLDKLSASRDWMIVLHLARNFGQHPATIAGVLHTSGDWVVTMDEDLQHPPEKIESMFAEISRAGGDVVYARPESAVHKSFFRDASSKTYKRMMEVLTGNKFVRYFNSFRLMRGHVARAAASVCNHDTYFDVAVCWFTDRITGVEMKLEDKRYIETGKSGYSFRSLLSHARRMLFTSQLSSLRLMSLFGFVMAALSVLLILVVVFQHLLFPGSVQTPGWTSTILSTAFFGGMTMLMLGFVLEILSTLIQRAHGKPLFFVVDRSRDHLLAKQFKVTDDPARADTRH